MESPYASHASAVARILKTFIPQDYGQIELSDILPSM